MTYQQLTAVQNSMWQACPVCHGQGNNMLGQGCHVCNGHGIISIISGLPPQHAKNKTVTSSSTTLSNYQQCWKHDVLFPLFEQCPKCLEESNK